MEKKCFYCGHDVEWNGDFDYKEIYGDTDENNKNKVVSFFTCPECGTEYEVTHG